MQNKIINEKDIFFISIKDFFTTKMLKYSLLPFIISIIVMYIIFFYIAGVGLEQLGSLDVQTTETTVQNGVPHTDSFSAQLEGMAIIQFLMSYTITSYIATFLVFAIGGFFVLYFSIFIAIIVIGFLTPMVLKELQKKHYQDIELIGYSNLIAGIFNMLKWAFVMILLFFILIPLYAVPIVNIIALNLPLYYFFHKMLTYDISSNICSSEENKQIKYFSKNKIRVKTVGLYLISLIPFAIFFGAVFYVIYLGHTYFLEVKEIRNIKELSNAN
ncbi:MAG: EI24 domain-containing protein [Campylobacterota bacterium]|nr:EI24 domain-containing protein [Campylobacterota bacterium]